MKKQNKKAVYGEMNFKIIVDKDADRALANILSWAQKNECHILSSECFKIESIEADDDYNAIINIHPSTYIFALEFIEESFQENFKKIGNARIMTITQESSI